MNADFGNTHNGITAGLSLSLSDSWSHRLFSLCRGSRRCCCSPYCLRRCLFLSLVIRFEKCNDKKEIINIYITNCIRQGFHQYIISGFGRSLGFQYEYVDSFIKKNNQKGYNSLMERPEAVEAGCRITFLINSLFSSFSFPKRLESFTQSPGVLLARLDHAGHLGRS